MSQTSKKKKQIILISPTSDDFRFDLETGRGGRYFPPLGILLVAQSLKNAGYDVQFFDGNEDPNYQEAILKAVADNSPEIVFVGFYLAFLQIRDCVVLLKSIKSKYPHLKTVIGGPFPAVFPEKVAASQWVDVCCNGDGAEISVQLADCIASGQDWSGIPNLCFRKNGEIINNPKTVTDTLSRDNFIYYENFLDLEKYVNQFDTYLGRALNPEIKRAIPILTALGCAYKCTFCEHAVLGNKHHSLGAEEVIEQVGYYHEKYNIDSFAFFDEEFFLDKERGYKLPDLLEKNPYKIRWGTQARASDIHDKYVNKEFLTRLENSGCIRFAMGIESGSPKILKKIKKGLTPEIAVRAATIGKDSSIDYSLGFIVNLPGETEEDLDMTIGLCKKLLSIKKNSFVSTVHTYFAYPGTPLADEVAENLGYRLEDHFEFEEFSDIDLFEYSKMVNPLSESSRICKITHFLYKNQPFEFKPKLRYIFKDVFKVLGLIREVLNFYDFSLEISLRDRFLKHASVNGAGKAFDPLSLSQNSTSSDKEMGGKS